LNHFIKLNKSALSLRGSRGAVGGTGVGVGFFLALALGASSSELVGIYQNINLAHKLFFYRVLYKENILIC